MCGLTCTHFGVAAGYLLSCLLWSAQLSWAWLSQLLCCMTQAGLLGSWQVRPDKGKSLKVPAWLLEHNLHYNSAS